jgi:uncharacterized protein YciI
MKTGSRRFIASLIGWALFGAAQAQPASAPVPAPAAASAAAPALRLFAVEIRTGARWNSALPPNQQPLMREHSANLRKLREEGRIRVGARYGEVGLIVLEAATIDEARAWMDADPAMRAGTFRYEIHPLGVIFPGTLAR